MKPKRPYPFYLLLLIPLIVVLNFSSVKSSVRDISSTVSKPFLLTGHALMQAVENVKKNFGYFVSTFQGQEKTQLRIVELENQLVQYQEAIKENERLKKLLEFRQTFQEKSVAAHVIGWDTNPWRKTAILDKGSKHGIKKDMAVVVPEGLIGRVTESFAHTSRVILLTDPDARVSGLTDTSRAQGIVAGNGSSSLKMKYLELDGGAAVGETILTAGIGGLFPKGFRIGKISNISRDETGLHLTATIEPFAQFNKLEEVLCLVSSTQK